MTDFRSEIEGKTELFNLSLEDILEDEEGGVFQPREYNDGYIIVFPRVNEEYINAIYIQNNSVLEDVAYDSWKGQLFRKLEGARIDVKVTL